MATSPLSEVVQNIRRAALLGDGADLTDGQLLECFISHREEAAIEALVQRHGHMVWGVCRRVLHDHHDAEDAFQATFLVLVRKATSIVPREMVGNWLYGVANQTALKAKGTIARRRGNERQMTEMPEPALSKPDGRHDLQWVLDEELCRLPDKYRVVILLSDLEGKTRQEVARQLGCPEGTVAGRLTRGRAMLAKRLARRALAVAGGSLAAVLAQNSASACVPTAVESLTIKAATLVAAGHGAAMGVVSTKVATLTEGVLKAMYITKLKMIVAVVLVLGMFAFAGIWLTYPMATAEQRQRDKSAVGDKKGDGAAKPVPKDEEKPNEKKAVKKEHGIQAEVRGVLRFENERGHYIDVKSANKAEQEMRVWLWIGEDKVTGRILEKLDGKEVIATGRLAQLAEGIQTRTVPPLGMYMNRFEIEAAGAR